MTNKNMNKKRARSKKEKEIQYQRILEEGKELFVKYGPGALSMRTLAKRLNMTQTFLYTYIQSKRELWIAIRQKYFQKYLIEINNIINEHQGTKVELLMKIALSFIEFANEDFNRFIVMFILPIPSSKKIGPIEKNYQQTGLLDKIKKILHEAMMVKEIKERNLDEFTYFIWSVIFGITTTDMYIKFHAPIMEYMKEKSPTFTKKSYRECALKEIKNLLVG
ncbi:MAG: TetR/AcrR family transcriptional regulator [Promethearchaeota archaeon]